MHQALVTNCPSCGSRDLKRIRYGLFEMDENIDPSVILGGCERGPTSADYRCTDCGESWKGPESHMDLVNRVQRTIHSAEGVASDLACCWIAARDQRPKVIYSQPSNGSLCESAQQLMNEMVGSEVRHACAAMSWPADNDRMVWRLSVLFAADVFLVQDTVILCEDGAGIQRVKPQEYSALARRLCARDGKNGGMRLGAVTISNAAIALTFEDELSLTWPGVRPT